MPIIKFKYRELPYLDIHTNSLSTIYRPLIQIRIKYGSNFVKYPFSCLVDSGADRNLFPAGIASVLGINVKKGIIRPHEGIGRYTINAYTHRVMIFAGTYSFQTEIDFAFEVTTPLLGRTGFFQYFDSVVFNEKDKCVELEY